MKKLLLILAINGTSIQLQAINEPSQLTTTTEYSSTEYLPRLTTNASDSAIKNALIKLLSDLKSFFATFIEKITSVSQKLDALAKTPIDTRAAQSSILATPVEKPISINNLSTIILGTSNKLNQLQQKNELPDSIRSHFIESSVRDIANHIKTLSALTGLNKELLLQLMDLSSLKPNEMAQIKELVGITKTTPTDALVQQFKDKKLILSIENISQDNYATMLKEHIEQLLNSMRPIATEFQQEYNNYLTDKNDTSLTKVKELYQKLTSVVDLQSPFFASFNIDVPALDNLFKEVVHVVEPVPSSPAERDEAIKELIAQSKNEVAAQAPDKDLILPIEPLKPVLPDLPTQQKQLEEVGYSFKNFGPGLQEIINQAITKVLAKRIIPEEIYINPGKSDSPIIILDKTRGTGGMKRYFDQNGVRVSQASISQMTLNVIQDIPAELLTATPAKSFNNTATARRLDQSNPQAEISFTDLPIETQNKILVGRVKVNAKPGVLHNKTYINPDGKIVYVDKLGEYFDASGKRIITNAYDAAGKVTRSPAIDQTFKAVVME